jgi:VanZ family protein
MKLAIFLGYGLIITWLSLSPGGGEGLPLWDKAMHLTLYALFVMLGSPLCQTRRGLYALAGGLLVYSGLMEIGQHFAPGRFMSAADLLANALGSALGLVASLHVQQANRKESPART